MALGFYVGLDSFSLLASSHNVRRKELRLREVGNAEGKGLSRALCREISLQLLSESGFVQPQCLLHLNTRHVPTVGQLISRQSLWTVSTFQHSGLLKQTYLPRTHHQQASPTICKCMMSFYSQSNDLSLLLGQD